MKTHRNSLFILLPIILLCAGYANPPAVQAAGPAVTQTPYETGTIASTRSIMPANEDVTLSPSILSSAEFASPTVGISPSPSVMPTQKPAATPAAWPRKFSPFTEDDFKKYFPFNRSMKDAEKELKSYKIAITEVYDNTDDADQPTDWVITTDQFTLCFDKRKHLSEVFMESDTAKGLQQGDSVERLHELYGKENDLDIDYDGYQHYIYNRNGYKFAVAFDPNGIALGWWVVYLNRVESPF